MHDGMQYDRSKV